MFAPVHCKLWSDPSLLDEGTKGHFDLVEVFESSSHLERQELRCKDCGQRYFFEFYEVVDWSEGRDKMYLTLVPVRDDNDIDVLRATDTLSIHTIQPRLLRDPDSSWHWSGGSAP